MTVDEQNRIDLLRMAEKRATATQLLKEWGEWHKDIHGYQSTGSQILVLGMLRDIVRGTEKDIDWLIYSLENKNNEALMKKLSS